MFIRIRNLIIIRLIYDFFHDFITRLLVFNFWFEVFLIFSWLF